MFLRVSTEGQFHGILASRPADHSSVKLFLLIDKVAINILWFSHSYCFLDVFKVPIKQNLWHAVNYHSK